MIDLEEKIRRRKDATISSGLLAEGIQKQTRSIVGWYGWLQIQFPLKIIMKMS